VNKGGGCCWSLDEIRRIRQVCDGNGLGLHLDGARLYNALVARGEAPRQYGELFDTVSLCLSKGLGAPVGSVLLGSKERIARAHRVRKVLGGGMRQAGYLAAAGLFALENHVARLREDHDRARELEAELRRLGYVESVLPVETNIVIFKLRDAVDTEAFLAYLRGRSMLALSIAKQTIRLVLHLDVSEAQCEALVGALKNYR
jgi:threonine aldolase